MRFGIAFGSVTDRREEGPAIADAAGPGNGVVAPHSQIPVARSRRVGCLVEREQDVRAAGTRIGPEGIPFVGHLPAGRKSAHDRAGGIGHDHVRFLELRRHRMPDEARADQRVDIPVPEINGIAASTMDRDEAAAMFDIGSEGATLRHRQRVAAHIIPDHRVEMAQIGDRDRAAPVGGDDPPSLARCDREQSGMRRGD